MELTKHMQEIFEFAKKTELDGKALYEEEYKKTDDEGLRAILKMLIEAEENHYRIFEEMQKGRNIPVSKTSILEVKNIFEKIKEKGQNFADMSDHAEFYKKVLVIEQTAEEFYRKEALNSSGEVKEVLLEIAAEEHRHVILIQNLTNYVINPKQWVEDAEFNNMKEY